MMHCQVQKFLNIKKVWNKFLRPKFLDFCLIIMKLKLEWWINSKLIVMQTFLGLNCLRVKSQWKKWPSLIHVVYQHAKGM